MRALEALRGSRVDGSGALEDDLEVIGGRGEARAAASWYARVWLSPLCGMGRLHTMTGHPDDLLERPGRGRTP